MAETIEIDLTAKDKTSGGVNSAKINIKELGEKVTNLGMKMTGAFTLPIAGLAALILKNEEVQKSLQPLKDQWAQVTNELATSVIPVIKDLTPTLIQLVKYIGEGVTWFSKLSVGQKETIISVLGVVAAIGPLIMVIGQVIAFVGTLSSVWGSLSAIIAPLTSTVLPAIGAVLAGITLPVWLLIGAIALLGAAIWVFGEDAWNTITMIGKIFESIPILIGIKVAEIKAKFTSVDWGAIGSNIMAGIRDGINKGLDWIINAARGAAQAALNAAKKLLGINSPSLVFAAVGKNMMQGMAKGIESNSGIPVSATSNAVKATVQSASNSNYSAGRGATLVYSPMISLSSQAEAENVLMPMLRKLQRSM